MNVFLQWLDRVLEAAGFGVLLLDYHPPSPCHCLFCVPQPPARPDVEFSICQGDSAASVFFTINIEPFLVVLELQRLHGLFMGGLCEATISYIDDVNELGEQEKDILIVDKVC
jgi:hypothetical protein